MGSWGYVSHLLKAKAKSANIEDTGTAGISSLKAADIRACLEFAGQLTVMEGLEAESAAK